MLVAEEKKKNNIAEYVMYMYQIEDIVRAYKFDIEAIIAGFVQPQLPDASFTNQYRKWYSDIISQMKMQKIEKVGHLVSTQDVLIEISYLHTTLLTIAKDSKYIAVFEATNKVIEEFKEKSNLKNKNEVEIAFHAMYMKLLLKLQKKEISAETEEAFDAMRVMLAYLSQSYHKMKAGDLDFLKN